MKTIYNLLIVLVLTTGTVLNAQTEISDFTISSPSVDQLNITSSFVKSDTNLIWTQDNQGTQRLNTFTIDSIEDSWNETDNIGTLTLNLSLNGYKAVFTLSGDATGASASLKLIDGNPNTQDQQFNFSINAITYN